MIFQARIVSSAKQRRSKFSSALVGKDLSPKMPSVPEERLASARSGKPKSPTAPVRRYLSSDKGAPTRNKVKFDVVDNQPMSKVILPAKPHATKSFNQVSETTSTDNNSGVYANHKSSDESKLNSLMHSTASSLGKVTQNMKKSNFF